MHTEDLEAFFAIAEAGSLSAAAQRLALPKSTISRRLGRLEDELGAQLILRTSRQSQLTELGETLRRRGAPALALLDELARDLSERASEPTGHLRLSAPADLAAMHLGPLCASVMSTYPKLEVSVMASNAFVDLIDQGIDVAMRIHRAALDDSSSLRARRLCSLQVGLYAAPSYLAAHPAIRKPEQLLDHRCLVMSGRGHQQRMQHARSGRSVELQLRAKLSSNEHQLLRDAAIAGAGPVTLPTFMGAIAVEQGRLQRVLETWTIRPATLSAVWPAAHHTSPRIKAFVQAAASYFSPPPWTTR